MGESCCASKATDLAALAKEQSRVLWIVLLINALMFVIEIGFGIYADSRALMADSLDMLGDTLAYASTLYVLKMSLKAKAYSSLFKAFLMFLTGGFIFIKTIFDFFHQTSPDPTLMSIIGGVALLANGFCLWLLSKHKNDDINFRSVWICSRNDIIANSSVIVAGLLVLATGSRYPDLIIGLGITLLFLKSSLEVTKEARALL